MKKLFKGIVTLVMSAAVIAMAAVPAFAASAKTGDSVELKVSVEGESRMGSTSITITYDKDKLDLLTEETLDGMGVVNTTVAGEIAWTNVFDVDGADYTKKTDVYDVILVAKQDISDVESLITFTVNDAYKIGASGVEPADPSCLSCSIALEGGSDQGSTVTSQSDNNAAGNNTAAQNNSNNANAANSTVSANMSSAESSKAATSSKAAESSSKAESKAESGRDSETSTETDTDSSAESTVSITATYDEAEFDSVPPIKLDEETSTADSRGSFPKGAVAGIAVCLVIAAAGIITIVVKKKG